METEVQVSVHKTKCYLIEFNRDPVGKWYLAKNNDYILLETQEKYQRIERLPTSQSSSILGVWISPDGYSHEQTRCLHQTTTTCSDRVRSGHIWESNKWLYFQTTVKVN